MKVTGITALLLADAVFATPAVDKRQLGALATVMCISGNKDTAIMGSQGNPVGSGRKAGAKEPPPVVKESTILPGAKQIKIRTGPYAAPGMKKQNSVSKLWGMLESYYDVDVAKPCSNCNILRQIGGLEYADGKNANIDSGLWLHHMVHFNTGPGRWDPTGVQGYYNPATKGSCKGCIPMEGLGPSMTAYATAERKKPTGTDAWNTERFFVTGNERTPFNYYNPDSEKKSAYHLNPTDKFFYLVELMNMNDADATVYITMTYDYTEGPLPADWEDIKTVYLDANACGSSEVESPHDQTKFSITSPKPWSPNISGRIVDSIGHLHDGGTNIEISAGPSKLMCNAKAVYADKPEFVAKMGGMLMDTGDKVAKDHISTMNGCGPKDITAVKTVENGQSWTTTGYYDYSKAKPNEVKHKENNKTGPGEVMAISIVVVAVKPGSASPPKRS